MKYIFHIHSNINLFTAINVIDRLNINKKDVLFFCFRGMAKNIEDISKVYLDDSICTHKYVGFISLKTKSVFFNKNNIKIIDREIFDFCKGDKFTYFTPHSKNSFYSIFISNKYCQQVHYIEDGMDAYLDMEEVLTKFPMEFSFKTAISNFIMLFIPNSSILRCRSRRYLYESIGDDKSKFYCITSEAFKFSKNKECVFESKTKYFNGINKEYFVFDALVEQRVISEPVFFDLINRAIENMTANDLHVKFHPAQKQKIRNKIIGLLSKRFNLIILNDDQILEFDFLSLGGVSVHGIGSSLLIYAAQNKSNLVFSYYKLIPKDCILDKKRSIVWDVCIDTYERINKITISD